MTPPTATPRERTCKHTTARGRTTHAPSNANRPRSGNLVSLLTLNIGAAAVPRATAILRWLRSRNDDLVVLTETSAGLGTDLLHGGFETAGYKVFRTADVRERGVMLATRLPVSRDLSKALSVTLPCRAGAIALETCPRVVLLG